MSTATWTIDKSNALYHVSRRRVPLVRDITPRAESTP
jgi:hypothetical protein